MSGELGIRHRALQAKAQHALRITGSVSTSSRKAAREIEAYAHWLLRENSLGSERFLVTPETALGSIISAQKAVGDGLLAPHRERTAALSKIADARKAKFAGRMAGIKPRFVTGAQIRAARAITGMSQRELASRSGLSALTISRFESVDGIPKSDISSIALVAHALESSGIVFIDPGEQKLGGHGVRFTV